jgi:hypothetical protein
VCDTLEPHAPALAGSVAEAKPGGVRATTATSSGASGSSRRSAAPTRPSHWTTSTCATRVLTVATSDALNQLFEDA